MAQGAAPRVRGAAAVSLVALACLVLITVRIDAGERRRELPAGVLAAGQGGGLNLKVTLSGFPAGARGFDDEPRSWVRGSIDSVAWGATQPNMRPAGPDHMRLGGVPVILWGPEAPDPTWYPGMGVCVSGGLKRGPPQDAAAYEVSVTAIEACQSAETGFWNAGSLARNLGHGIASMRSGLRGVAAETRDAELVPGLAVGDTELVSDEIDDLMLEANLTHLTAVSGDADDTEGELSDAFIRTTARDTPAPAIASRCRSLSLCGRPVRVIAGSLLIVLIGAALITDFYAGPMRTTAIAVAFFAMGAVLSRGAHLARWPGWPALVALILIAPTDG
ncbi:hypothetical protein [Leucobacter komagatae]|uniref:hypothetical protein n=1 Tax=Leucobacter komagatae TaxID=55969 RepID=UPI001153743A|nr:hypothetical protein [Leucobacter komagatae]